MASFERRVEADRDALKIPGLSFIVIQDGEVLSARGFGHAEVAETRSQFFLKIRPWTLTFVKEGSRVTRLDLQDSGQMMSGRRVD